MNRINYNDNNLKQFYFLIKGKTIQEIFEKGYLFQKDYIRMFFIKKTSKNGRDSKIILFVYKKIIIKACKRNQLKRLIKQAYRLNKFLINEIYFIILIYRKNKFYKSFIVKKEIRNFLSIL